jgi:pentatricopeptide repeat protein
LQVLRCRFISSCRRKASFRSPDRDLPPQGRPPFSFSSWTKQQNAELQKAVSTLVEIPVGEINEEGWENVEHIIRKCCQQDHGGVEPSFQVLDRIANETGSPANFNPLNTAVLNWRNEYSKDPKYTLSPQVIVEKIDKLRQSGGFLQPDAKTYTMIIEASSNDTDGVTFSENLLEWMLEESKTQFLIQPTTVTFAAVMNSWALSGRPEAPTKIEKLIQKMKALHDQGWPDIFPNIVVYNIRLKALSRAGNVEEAERLLQTMMGDDNSVEPDRISFTTLLSAYSNLKHPQAAVRAETLLSQMHELYEAGYESLKPNMISYTIVMDCHAKLGQGEQAEALLRKLVQMHTKTDDPDYMADLTTYNSVLLAWARSNQPERADRFLRFVYEEATVKPDERSFNIVLSAWAKVGAAQKAEDILTRMHELYMDGKLETRPTTVTYNTVLDSWSKSNQKDAWKRSTKILDHMAELCNAGDSFVKPNERTWNAVLNALAKAGQIEMAATYIDEFVEASKEHKVDGKPSVRAWNALLAACMRQRDVSMATKFWQQMKDAGIKPDVVSYNTLLNCFTRASTKKRSYRKNLETTFRELQHDQNVRPNRISFLALINYWIQSGKIENAENILKEMYKNHAMTGMIEPDRELFHKVLAAWSENRSPRKAEALLFKMLELHERHGFDVKPVAETYNRLLNAWAKSGETDSGERADSILRQMESFARGGDDDVFPDIISYNSVLNAWANSGDPTAITRIEHLILEMILKGNPKLTPTVVSYGTWLKAIASSTEEDKERRAREVVKTMKIHKLEPTDFILQKIESLTASGISNRPRKK